jgi:hypothetical protein
MFKVSIQFTGTDSNHTVDTGTIVAGIPEEPADWVGIIAAIVDYAGLSESDRDYLVGII